MIADPCSVLITAGPTQEPIDEVRYLGNHSSGRMGQALAAAFQAAGAAVTLVCGPVAWNGPAGLRRLDVRTAAEMAATVEEVLAEGPIPAGRLEAEAAEAGHAWGTVRRAKKAAGVIVEKEGFAGGGRWVWRLGP